MSFEDKILNYLAEIHQKITGIENEVAGVKAEVAGVKAEVADIKKTVINIENSHGEKLSALFDGYEHNTKSIKELSKDVKSLEKRVATQEIKLQLIK
ncbi:hypothetical protein [Desulfitibacter alkalitolerans]|uniref:hypothetical protein n=1 Tax=Desulfitibacter alkalitolerans TaxID=264641 RepID=UPI0004862158|nr:hypothetical protein [Desulfitibacter alkalitolerans]